MSPKDATVLAHLADMTRERGFPPALRDLARRCGYSEMAGPGTVLQHLHNLKRHGLVLGPSSDGSVRQYRARPDIFASKGVPYRIVAQMLPPPENARNACQAAPQRDSEGLAS
jgi:LexA DNA binding domain